MCLCRWMVCCDDMACGQPPRPGSCPDCNEITYMALTGALFNEAEAPVFIKARPNFTAKMLLNKFIVIAAKHVYNIMMCCATANARPAVRPLSAASPAGRYGARTHIPFRLNFWAQNYKVLTTLSGAAPFACPAACYTTYLRPAACRCWRALDPHCRHFITALHQ